MRSTRFEMLNELRRLLGHSEEIEMLSDWLQDVWQTYDTLVICLGQERAYQMINAIDLYSDNITPHNLPSYDHTNESREQCLLN